MDGESKRTHKLTVCLNYTDGKKKSHCNMSSCCGLAVELLSPAESAGSTLFHRQEEKSPREETSVKQGKEALQS